MDTKKVNIRNTDKDSIFFIRAAERADSGVYEMCVKVDSFEDKAQVTLQIVGKCSYTTWTMVYVSFKIFFLTFYFVDLFTRVAWTSSQCQDRGLLGFQCCSGMDRTQGYWKHNNHWIHHPEG